MGTTQEHNYHDVVVDICKGRVEPEKVVVRPGDTVIFRGIDEEDFFIFFKGKESPFRHARLCTCDGVVCARVTARVEKETAYEYGLFLPGSDPIDPIIIVQPW